MPTKKPNPGTHQVPSQVDVIVADCIAADPSLAGREAELRAIVASLLAAKPDVKFDQAFARKLRDMLTERAAALQGNPAKVAPPTHSFFESMKNKPLFMALSGGVVLSLLVVAVLVRPDGTGLPQQIASDFSGAGADNVKQIAVVGPNAFGMLATDSQAAVSEGMQAPMADGREGTTVSANPRPQSGGGGSTGMTSTTMVADKMMVPPDYVPTNYVYSYKGELALEESSVDVFRHIKGLSGSTSASAFTSMVSGLANGSKFSSARVQNVSLIEDREYGYYINIDAMEGTLSMSQNWQRWPHPENTCTDEACFQRYQTPYDQMPSDAELIAIADDFLSEYGISGSNLGQPEVRDEQRMYITSVSARPAFAPGAVQVVYPLLLDGEPVTDESGLASGLTLTVNVRERRIDNMWGLTTNRYEQSAYDAVTDSASVLAFVAKGGYGWTDPSAKTVELELGAPERVLSRHYTVDSAGQSQELFVPMLRFPIMNPPADQPWFRKAILVPLAQELFDQMNAGQNGGVPTPLMYTTDGGAVAVPPPTSATEPAVDPASTR